MLLGIQQGGSQTDYDLHNLCLRKTDKKILEL